MWTLDIGRERFLKIWLYKWGGLSFYLFILILFYNCIIRLGFLPWKIWVAFLVESQLRQSRTVQPTVHAGYFSVSIIYWTLTWTTGSLICAQILMHGIAHGGVWDTLRKSALKVDSGRKIPCLTGESNLRRQRAGQMLYPLSYIPTHLLLRGERCTVLRTYSTAGNSHHLFIFWCKVCIQK